MGSTCCALSAPNHRPLPRLTLQDRLWSLGIFLALAALYWRHNCHTFGAGDSPQHVLSALTWGVSRPPGYPLYTMLAHFFSLLPFGDPPSLVNGLSGLMHAAASALFFLILRRSRCGTAAAVAATAFMSLSSLYWYYSEVAEVRAFNDLLALAAAFLVISLPERPRPVHGLELGAILGLGIGHHPTYVLLLPAVMYLFYKRYPKNACWAAAALSAAAACAAPYVLLWLRLKWGPAPLYDPDNVYTAKDVLDLFLRKNTGGALSFASGVPGLTTPMFEPARCLRELGWFAQLILRDLMPAGLLLVVLGCVRLWKTARPALVFGDFGSWGPCCRWC